MLNRPGFKFYRAPDDEGAGGGSPPPPPASPPPASPPPPPPPAGDGTGDFSVPDAYKDKPWSAKIKTQDDLWKQLDNTQTLVGKKSVIPDFEKGDQKEIDEYIGQLRPKDKSAYKLADTIPEEERGPIVDILHEAGLPAPIANKMMEKMMAHVLGLSSKMYDRDDFFKAAEGKFGAGYKDTIGKAKQLVNGVIPKELAERIDAMPNEYHVAFYEGLKAIMDKYGATESGAPGEGGEGAGADNKEEARKAIRAEIATLEKKPHTVEQKMALQNKLADTYKK